MMIRSAPPSSAHLADKPVPAPAPIIRSPRATTARSLAFQSGFSVFIFRILRERSRAGGVGCRHAQRPAQFQEHLCRALRKDRVVDIAVDFDHRYALVQAGADSVKAGKVSLCIPK